VGIRRKFKLALLGFENTGLYFVVGFIIGRLIPIQFYLFILGMAACVALVEIMFWKKLVVIESPPIECDWEEINFLEATRMIITTLTHLTTGYLLGWVSVR
jgi:hypothetical protein